ncbi:hypothetical protein E3N88_41258 [Mikania micrantha]|uniref:Uncharacterized protein n=1 Tax=Mikania micrantha TaxID=192012 RepID=A0A5N6LQW7_9ASTR|nr:hypothetical protein E3N88_41258 [Mikania micrantha]
MASIDPSLLSNPKEQKWVDETSKILNHQLETDIEIPSVTQFQVPETMTTKKPETYEPQQIGLGPIHHFQPRTYKKMEQKKLDVMRKVLKANDIKDYELTILNNVKKVVPIVRSCYDMFLEHDDEHLTWVFAIDGLFLLNIFQNYNQPKRPKVGPKKRLVAQDVLMVENQIPFFVLKEIDESLCSSSERRAPSNVDHLLHYMYYSIVNNVHPLVPVDRSFPHPLPESDVSEILENMPKDEIVHAYEQTISILETFTQTKLIIPSASKLHAAGFKFHNPKEDEGIKDTRVWGKDVYLPIVTLNKDSDVILKNLVAYEALTSNSNSFPLADFMVLMCALVVNVDDVKRLENVIKGDLLADEVVKLFTGMSGSIPDMKTTEKTELQETIDEINMAYNSMWRMKPYLFLKKFALWLLVALKAIGGFVGSSWKIVAFILSLVSVFMLMAKAYCDVFGCESFTQTKLIAPSASNLHAAGFKFHSLKEDKGIKDTRLSGKDVYLPIVTLNKDSDVVLKNLVAYEALTSNSNSFPLAELMVLMCALVVNVDDVKRLENVIKGDLRADEVIKLFIRISGSIPVMKTNKKSNVQGTIDKINMAYNNRLSMKAIFVVKEACTMVTSSFKGYWLVCWIYMEDCSLCGWSCDSVHVNVASLL